MSVRNKLFSFKGRLRRRDWWIWGLATALTQLLCSFAVARAIGMKVSEASLASPFTQGWLVITGVSLPFMWPNFALAVKRAHDRTVAGIWAVVPTAVLYSQQFVSPPSGSPRELALNIAVAIAALFALVLLGILDGVPTPNRYGPSPKTRRQFAEVFS